MLKGPSICQRRMLCGLLKLVKGDGLVCLLPLFQQGGA